ncbi:hypothetical protein GmHk_08G023406 [Glycine max]|nr:hypothetical protein GmHk_08G023406 [Glycine max]
MRQSTTVAVDVRRAAVACGSRVHRVSVIGRRSLACVVCWSAAVALENVVCSCRVRRRRLRRRSSRCRLLLVTPLKRRNSGRVGSGQPNPCRACFLKIKIPLFRHSCDSAMTAMAMAVAIRNPQRHRYLVITTSSGRRLANVFAKSLRGPRIGYICNKLSAYDLYAPT